MRSLVLYSGTTGPESIAGTGVISLALSFVQSLAYGMNQYAREVVTGILRRGQWAERVSQVVA